MDRSLTPASFGAIPSAGQDGRLPRLRDDLRIEPMHARAHGRAEHQWIIVDPLRHQFFRVSQPVFDLLAQWSAGTRERLRIAMLGRHRRNVGEAGMS